MNIGLKVTAVFTLVALCAGCEMHRRLEEQRRLEDAALESRRRIMQDVLLRQQRQKAIEDVYRSVHRSRSGNIISPEGSSRLQRRRATGSPGSSSSVYIPSLPYGNKFCNGSDVYFCPIADECILGDDGIYRCISRPRVIRTRYPSGTTKFIPRTGSESDGSRVSVIRFCPEGFRSISDGRCMDIDECTFSGTCNASNETCVNLPGSYRCECKKGFSRQNGSCLDIDECETEGACIIGSCSNSLGSYSCECPAGYKQTDDFRCRDVDECRDENPCGDGKICFNTWGKHICEDPVTCPEGYRLLDTNDYTSTTCVRSSSDAPGNHSPVIVYRKRVVSADEPEVLGQFRTSRVLATLTYSSRDQRYNHYFSPRAISGDNLAVQTVSSRAGALKFNIITNGTLHDGEDVTLNMKVFDYPTLRVAQTCRIYTGYRICDPPSPKQTSQELVFTFVPSAIGS